MGWGLFLGCPSLPSQRAGSQRPYVLGFLSIYAYTLWLRTIKFHMVTREESACFLGGDPHLYHSGRGPSAPQILGFLSIYGYALLSQNYQIRRGKNMSWRGVYLGFSHTSNLRYLCLHSVTQKDQIRHGKGKVGVLVGQPRTPSRLNKYVARFVSDSWFFLSAMH